MDAILGELNRAFGILNARLFGDKLQIPPVVMDLKKKFIMKYQTGCLVVGSKFQNITAHDILLNMLHEMIHVHNEQNEIVDVTANQYHNKKFLRMALNVGLVTKKHKIQGWGITGTNIPKGGYDPEEVQVPPRNAVQERITAFQDVCFNQELLVAAQEKMKKKLSEKPPPKPCFLKYECKCPLPHNSIRSGRRPDGEYPLRITCDVCGAKFVCVTKNL